MQVNFKLLYGHWRSQVYFLNALGPICLLRAPFNRFGCLSCYQAKELYTLSSLAAVGTSSLHSSLEVPPMPLLAERFLQPLLPCLSPLQSFTAPWAGCHRPFRSRGKYSALSAAAGVGGDTETLVQRTGSTLSISFCCVMRHTQVTISAPVWGPHSEVSANPPTKQKFNFSF